MNLFKQVSVSALFLLAGTTILAQNLIEPGTLPGPASGAETALPFSAGTSSALPKTNIAGVEDAHSKHVRVIWVASIFAMAAGTAADAASSWNKRERNGLLASSNGTFGDRGLAIKGGIAAGMLVPQVIFRKHQDWRIAFAVGNFAEAGIFTGATIHNLSVNSSAK